MNERKSFFLGLFVLMVMFTLPSSSFCAQKAAAIIEDGYAGKVLQKILATGKVQPTQTGSVKLYLDEEGAYTDCSKLKGSDTAAICAAAKAASPFGQPPYGVKTNLVLAFWINNKDLQTKNAAQTQDQPAAAANQNPYISQIAKELRNSIYIPQETKKGVYHASVLLNLSKSGQITKSALLKKSGDARLDKYIMQGVARAGRVTAPPEGIKNPVEVSLTFKR